MGHTISECSFGAVDGKRCHQCGKLGHIAKECAEGVRCYNCEGPHAANSAACPMYRAKIRGQRVPTRTAGGNELTGELGKSSTSKLALGTPNGFESGLTATERRASRKRSNTSPLTGEQLARKAVQRNDKTTSD